MKKYRIDQSEGIEIGLYTLGDHLPDPEDGKRVSAQERIKEIVDYAWEAEQAGLDFFSVGESHQEYFAAQAHAVVLGAAAQATKKIKLGSSSTIIGTSDPVRVFENFATIDLLSGGRAEIVAGRASRAGLFELLGYDIRNYEELFEEKFELLLKINKEEVINWNGKFRAPLKDAQVLPRPVEGSMPVWRAVGGTPASAVKAGKAGVPMFMAHLGGPASMFKRTIDAYREAAEESGHDSSELPIATAGFFYAAETSQQAVDELYPHINEGMKRTNGQGFPKAQFAHGMEKESIMNVGSPQQIIEKILYQHEMFGHQRYTAQIDFGGMPFRKVQKNLELLGTEIIPAVKKYTAKK
ncbi:LLM class flavin-dependent oxidoreductase [Alkalicoccus saliphilus]|jgi:alkanesulfonate monooxygenase SsuD/methylene tetrahydromethanopterin reductase-like flavin-dependent oxidoreductase (luciferase family)|uniref:LLM class flavin-dependent oxidoreductase n=1 Tax=Alkalicoccus saliphilus TaxID=200989 RepID=A0A2T4U9R8_9BACI|nr:LLM class flavin-dependent oxidoreductase [Alkalicoccus saliphilus]PTL40142.1 LLM class flavin-dependent oxidoreductase [Alkalicoccus saliphilus]